MMFTGRLGKPQYAAILCSVYRKPGCLGDILARFLVGGNQCNRRQTMCEILWRMVQLGLLDVTGWVRETGAKGFLSPVFAGGSGRVEPYPGYAREPEAGRKRRDPPGSRVLSTRPEMVAFANVVKAMRGASVTRNEIQEATGVHRNHINTTLDALRAGKMLHTSGWIPRDNGGAPAMMLTFGPGKDVPRPETMTRQEINARREAGRQAKRQMLELINATRADPLNRTAVNCEEVAA
jgi:hypothetical protein